MMTGRTPAEAANSFIEKHQRAISCVADAVLHVSGGFYPRPQPHGAVLSENPAVLRTHQSALGLYVAFQYKIAETSARGDRWEIQIAGYRFALWNASVSEIISYHWHPVGVSAVTTPHLHLGPGALVGRDELKAAHLPTGAIALAGVIRLAIADLGVVPRRSDWAEVLQ